MLIPELEQSSQRRYDRVLKFSYDRAQHFPSPSFNISTTSDKRRTIPTYTTTALKHTASELEHKSDSEQYEGRTAVELTVQLEDEQV